MSNQTLFDRYMESCERVHSYFQYDDFYSSVAYHDAKDEMIALSNAWRLSEFGTIDLETKPDVTVSDVQPESALQSVTPRKLTWMEEAVEEALREDAEMEAAKAQRAPKSKTERLQAAYDDAKQHCPALPENGSVEFKRGHGYFVYHTDNRGRLHSYCWLGTFDCGMRFLNAAKADGIPTYALLRTGK